ncbi:hypothetical protein PILCRDRAFT_268964 [Piloderma croceum F 1598]|uniref:Uncharacterized protein n=1 Tax=Piloderma croceum (strain F 1598) TaxID=765440 RepID=A0A0C3FUF5_PILCF|nr:hypothetical protein PILCRDRAFT_268964 [Piloderma croceum F 1598]
MHHSLSVQIDSATSSLGFLAHDRSYLRFRDFVSLGHDEPPIKFTYIADEQRAKTYSMTAGLTGGKPSATAAYTYAKMGSTTTQAAEDTPSPRWVVKSQATDESWNSAIRSYSALNAKIYRWPQGPLPLANIVHDMQLDVKYGMSVEVAEPIRKVCSCQGLALDTNTYDHVHIYIRITQRFRLYIGIRYIVGLQSNQRLGVAVSLWWLQ